MVARFDTPTVRAIAWTATIIALAIIYLPPLYLLAISLNQNLQPGWPGLDDLSLRWYVELAGDTQLLDALQESILIGAVSATIATIVGLLAALAYLELKRGRAAWFMFVIFSLFVPGVIQGLALSAIYNRQEITPSWATVVSAHLLWALPFAFTVILTSLGAVKRSYLLAAADLGASWLRRIRDVVLPLIRSGLISAFVFSFLLSLNEYNRAFYLVGRQNTLPLDMFGQMNSGASPTIYALSGAILAASLFAVGIVVVISLQGKHNRSG